MTMTPELLALSFAIGAVSGLRSMMAPAIVAWSVHRGWLVPHDSRLAIAGSTTVTALCIFGALGELVVDKLPITPSRLRIPSLMVRAILGGLSAAVLTAAASQAVPVGAIVGGVGGIAGSYAGYHARHALVRATGGRDLPIALIEDAIAIAIGFFVVLQH
jgi:uncharacterized membrane protein